MANDLISSLKSWAKLYDKPWKNDFSKGFRDGVFAAIEAVKEYDAAPVRRGKWEFNGISVACSECGSNKPTKAQDHKLATQEIRFCYYCGADMREAAHETN